MKKLCVLFLGLLVVATNAQADYGKDRYLCEDKASSEPLLEIDIVKNKYGVAQQKLTVKKDFAVEDFIVSAGASFLANNPPIYTDSDACTDRSFIGVTDIDTEQAELIFFCDMDSGPQYTVSIADLICR